MIVDSSALVTVLLRQDGHERVLDLLAADAAPAVGAPTLVETGIVMHSRVGPEGVAALGQLVSESGLAILPLGEEHWRVAVSAYGRFGKGRHPAALNFGDCLTYAVAWLAGEPLLCTGDDFARTDLQLVA